MKLITSIIKSSRVLSFHTNKQFSYHTCAALLKADPKAPKAPETDDKKEKINFSFDIVEEDQIKKDDWFMSEKDAAQNFVEEEDFRTKKTFLNPSS